MPVLRPAERIGTTLGGRYRLDEVIGAGGMGVVFRGTHTWTERPVAVKVLNDLSDPELVRRFFREAKAATKIAHDNVVDVLDMGEASDGSPFIVLELLEGESLAERLARRPMTPEEALTFALPVMDALATAHASDVVHRDVKPENLFLHTDTKGRLVPKIVDFGISKLLDVTLSVQTKAGTMIGTPEYMSPEQIEGSKSIDGQSDVWSIGVVLFEALAGQPPFSDRSPLGIVIKVAREPAPKLASEAPDVPPALAAAVDRALEKPRDARHASMHAFMDALLEAAAEAGIEVSDPREVGGRASRA